MDLNAPPYYMSTSGGSPTFRAHQQQRGAAPVIVDEGASPDDWDHVISDIVNEHKDPELDLDMDMAGMIDIPDLPAEDEATSRRPMPFDLFADLELNVDADIAGADPGAVTGAETEAETGAESGADTKEKNEEEEKEKN